MTDQCKEQLFNTGPEAYGDSFQTDLLELYKHYVESAEKISERRVTTNNYLLTVNAALVALHGVVAAGKLSTAGAIFIPLAGILVSVNWFLIVNSYRNLNSAKFKVIHELEERLPVSIYSYEWHCADRGKTKAYRPVSHLERWIPTMFTGLYAVLAGIGIIQCIS